jgi:hypothetical protein
MSDSLSLRILLGTDEMILEIKLGKEFMLQTYRTLNHDWQKEKNLKNL